MEIFSFCGFAFEVAYEDLASGESIVWDAAVSEIAKMSFQVEDLYPLLAKTPRLAGLLSLCIHSVIDQFRFRLV